MVEPLRDPTEVFCRRSVLIESGGMKNPNHLPQKEEEYEEIVDYAIELGIENGFIQEGETAEESFIPNFDLEGVDL